MEAFEIGKDQIVCPTAVVIKQRSPVTNIDYTKVEPWGNSAEAIHMGVLQALTAQVLI